MHRLGLAALLALSLPVLSLVPAPRDARAEPATLPAARQVIVRGQKDLAHAIAAAAGGMENGVGAILLDVTPHTRAAAGAIRTALMALGTRRGVPRRWRIARLGDTFSPPVPDAARLATLLPTLLKDDTPVTDTIGALRRSIASLDGAGAVVYLADWRFEDAHDLEDLVDLLGKRTLRFGVVGSEAGFGRGWHDGVPDERRRALARPDADAYVPTIGRRPFGPFDDEAPWHGGDTAAPHAPYRFTGGFWATEFTPSDLRFAEDGVLDLGMLGGGPKDLEDLTERLGGGAKVSGDARATRFPLPSAFGPHGLMRAAAVTGGRYVLWSWNPERRVSIRYEPARCDAFGPDLRSRTAIRRDYPRQPLGVAMLRAWHRLNERRTAVLAHTPPLGAAGRGPGSIDLVDAQRARLDTSWCDRASHRAFLDRAAAWRDATAAAVRDLDLAITKHAPGADADPASRRMAADAALMRHALAVVAFELAEAVAVARTLPKDAFDDDHCVALRARTWIERGEDPDAIRVTDAPVQDPTAGAALKAARAAHLRRFRGTPFGLQVAANTVDTWTLHRWRPHRGGHSVPTGRAPAESGGETPDTPRGPGAPGGPSGGGGPATGGGR